MNNVFRVLRQYLGPAWLTQGGDSQLVGYSLDLIRDVYVERVRLGLLARFPQQDPTGTPGPDDALAAIGRDRRMIRGINESATSYAARLLTWLDVRQQQGNAFALMDTLAAYLGAGCVFRTVDNSGNWYTRNVDGSRSLLLNQANWNWDGAGSAQWSRFWVFIYPPSTLWQVEGTWGSSTWGDGGVWGSTETSDQVTTIKALVNEWKPAGTLCVNIVIAFDSVSFAPTAADVLPGMPAGQWSHWSTNQAGVQAPIRLSTARYGDGL